MYLHIELLLSCFCNLFDYIRTTTIAEFTVFFNIFYNVADHNIVFKIHCCYEVILVYDQTGRSLVIYHARIV